jgi:hypothetical protein
MQCPISVAFASGPSLIRTRMFRSQTSRSVIVPGLVGEAVEPAA